MIGESDTIIIKDENNCSENGEWLCTNRNARERERERETENENEN